MFSTSLLSRAEMGDLEAILDIANSYYMGANTVIDGERAFYWYNIAFEIAPDNTKAINGLADCYRKGMHVKADDFKSMELYKKSASLNDAYATCMLAASYWDGVVNQKDIDKAIVYLEKSARLESLKAIDYLYDAYCEKYGEATANIKYIEFLRILAAEQNPFAMIRLFDAYTEEELAPRDENTAMYYLTQAVSMNCPRAITTLAAAYARGDVASIEKDEQKAKELTDKAAKMNDEWALCILAHGYNYGADGYPQDVIKAKEYYERCIELGEIFYSDALSELGLELCDNRNSFFDSERGVNLLSKASELGQVSATNYLGRILLYGLHGVQKDEEMAVKLFETAVQQGNLNAMEDLGICAYEGKGMPVDKNRARMLFENCAREGLPQSQYNFALMNCQGDGGPLNYKAAEYWYKKVIESDIDSFTNDAKWDLACMYSENTKEYNKAFPLWTEFAKKGNADAQYNVGLFYAKGWGVPQDDNIAKYWIGEAAKQGNPAAIEAMETINNNNYIPNNDHYGNGNTPVEDVENEVKADDSIYNKIIILTPVFFVIGFLTAIIISQEFLISLIAAYLISAIPLSFMRLKGLKMSGGQAVMTAAAGYFANRENGCTFALAFMLGRWLMNYLISAITLPYWYIKSIIAVII